MNIKLHTPKSLKAGSGLSTVKQFVLSLVATTISIILTFGTAAWVDNMKKEKERHEMVMMILYDISGSIKDIEKADSVYREGFEKQIQVAAHPELLTENPFIFTMHFPQLHYTETVENIFSSNIETINTLGNVLFAENVSTIYQERRDLKVNTVEKFREDFAANGVPSKYDDVAGLNFLSCISACTMSLHVMKEKFEQCKQMMGVSDEELEVYRQKRINMEQTAKRDSINNAQVEEVLQNAKRLKAAEEKGRELLRKPGI